MKKVVSIIAVVMFTLGLFATQLQNDSISTDIENANSCGECESPMMEREGISCGECESPMMEREGIS